MSLLQEIRFSSRALRKSPGFTITAIAALALGIGANTAISSVAQAFLLRPLNVPNLARLMMIVNNSPGDDQEWRRVSPADYRDLRGQTHSFEAMAAYRGEDVNVSGDAHPEVLSAALVTDGFFNTLQSQPQWGHPLREDRQVLLTYELWTRRYNADPGAIGKTMRLNSANYVIAGVMPKSFKFPVATDLWIPLSLTTAEMGVRAEHTLQVVGRLRAGVTPQEAVQEVTALSLRIEKQFPESHRDWHTRVISLREYVSGHYTGQYIILLLISVFLVLLIASANVANLQFARAISRQKELAVHGALGATRWRILRQLLTESLLISLAAGLIALPVGQFAIELIIWNMPPTVATYVAGWDNIQLDWRILGFTFLLAALVGILAGIVPAIQFSRVNPGSALKEGSRGSSQGKATDNARVLLLTFEIALSMILLIGAGLMVRGARAFAGAGDEMQPRSLLTVQFTPLDFKDRDRHQQAAFYMRILNAMSSVPGVRLAALSTVIPFNGPGIDTYFQIEGRPVPPSSERTSAALQSVSPEALEMMHSALIAGRRLEGRDAPDFMPVAVISRQMAKKFWPHESPLGKRIRLDGNESPVTIVGITGDVVYNLYDREPSAVLYVPYTQHPTAFSCLTVRAAGDPGALVGAVRQRFQAIAPDQPLSRFQTLDVVRMESAIGMDYVAAMLSVSGAVAFVLACIGIYGVVAYAVAQRTREIGIRVSLGAKSWDVLGLVMRRNLAVIALGLAIGLAASIALARAIASLVFGVAALDITVFAGVSLLLAAVAVLATLIPAWRVLGIEPVLALRSE